MKKDRNCGMPFPVYPPYQTMPMGMNPAMPMPGMQAPGMGMPTPGMGMPTPGMGMGMPAQMGPTTGVNVGMQPDGSLEQQMAMMRQQINSLDRRVTQLENTVGQSNTFSNTGFNNTGYNTSSYQML